MLVIDGTIIVAQPLVIDGEAVVASPLNVDGQIVVSGTAVPGPPGPQGPQGPQGPAGADANMDFVHTPNTSISTATTTVTFAADERCTQMVTVTADLGIAIVCNNSADNYLWVRNSHATDAADITISGITYNGSPIASADIHIAGGTMTVEAGKILEIGIVCNADGAFLTSRNDL